MLLPALLGGAGIATHAAAQDSAAAAAGRELSEDNYKRIMARIEALEERLALMQQQLGALDRSVAEVRLKAERAENNTAHQERISRLAEQIQKVDEARVTENRRIQNSLEDLARIMKSVASAPPPPRLASPPPTVNPGHGGTAAGAASEDGYWHTVAKGDTLGEIVQAYRAQGIMVTTKAVLDANPTVKPDVLPVGKKIWIPKPKG